MGIAPGRGGKFMNDEKRDERKRQEDKDADDLATRPPASPPRAGRAPQGVGGAVTGPRGVGAPDVTHEDVPAREDER
jgi:hypothetical protein